MKTCPSCHRSYEDDSLTFCLDDGAALLAATIAADPNATLRMPEPRVTAPGATVAGPQAPTLPAQPMKVPPGVPAVISPSAVAGSGTRKSPLPWILGIVIVLGVSGIVIALIIARSLQQGSQQVAQTNAASPSPSQSESSSPVSTSSPSANSSSSPQAQSASSPSSQSNSASAGPTPTPRSPAPSKVELVDDPPPPTSKPTPHAPISGGVLNGKAISLPAPRYPAIARQAHASGTVVVQVLIDEAGNVISAHAISGHPLLQPVSVQAAYKAKFSPTILSGQPVKVNGIIQYHFEAPMGR